MNRNEVLKTIYERRSVRKYKDLPVTKDLVEEVISAGRMAPSSMGRQFWKFHILTDRAHIHAFSRAIIRAGAKGLIEIGMLNWANNDLDSFTLEDKVHFMELADPIFFNAPVLIFITAPRFDEFAVLDIGMCAQNMLLAAKSLGLDSCTCGFGKLIQFTDLYKTLNISQSEEIYLSIVLGYGDENPQAGKRIEDNIYYL